MWGGLSKDNRGILLPRHFDNSVSVYLFLKFDLWLGKSEKFNSQGMKENRAFRIFFIIKKKNTKQTDFAKNFPETPLQNIQRYLNPLFQHILF